MTTRTTRFPLAVPTLTAVLLASMPARAAEERPRIEPIRAATAPAIDGLLDDALWQGAALPLTEWLTYNPLNGDRLEQKTEVLAAYDDRYLYFAFRCLDPDPGKVRSNISRRDNMFNDDWVGLSLDSVGNGQASYDMFVNPAGIQGDILTTPSAGENTAPDWVWESAGRRTDAGFDVEVRLPLTSIRFKSGTDVSMGVLFWRRVSRLGISASWPDVPAGKSFIERHATMVLHDLDRPLTLELGPSATYSWQQLQATPDSSAPADSDPDAGLSVKYGITSSATLEGTVNPDFSQVESDAYQVEVNQRFPVFYPEKRPFFMEGLGNFEMAGVGGDAIMRTAVHTRKIVDPFWGFKSTGTQGRVTFGMLAAGDDAPGELVGPQPNPFLGERKDFYIARGQYSLGKSSYLGAIATDTEFGYGHNRVVGGDLSLRWEKQSASATFLGTATRTPEGTESQDGLGGQFSYYFDTKRWSLGTQVEHYDPGFQMDTAFLNQVGITQGWVYASPSFYPDAKKYGWFKRFTPFVFFQYGRDRIHHGYPWLVVTGVRMNFTRQGFLRVDTAFGEQPWVGQTFRTTNTRIFAEGQILRWLYIYSRVTFGRAIYYDPVNPFPGRQRTYQGEVTLQPSARLNQKVTYERVEFDRQSDGSRVFTVDVLNTTTTFQINRHFFLRAIVQYDSSLHRVLTDFLASYELMPGTVAYAGYGSLIERREWDGRAWTPGLGTYGTSQRSLFFKTAYVHRF
jgi:hypothetical protein